MSQSCETLITRINEWQKAVLELEKLSEEFLNSGDKTVKEKIENQKKEIEKRGQEYSELAYQELPDGRELFWPEKEALDEITERTRLDEVNQRRIKIRNNHLVFISLSRINLSRFSFDFSLFQNLEEFLALNCQLKKLPRLSISVRKIWIEDKPSMTKKGKRRIKNEYPNAKIFIEDY